MSDSSQDNIRYSVDELLNDISKQSVGMPPVLWCGEAFLRKHLELNLRREVEDLCEALKQMDWISADWVDDSGVQWYRINLEQEQLPSAEVLSEYIKHNDIKYLAYGEPQQPEPKQPKHSVPFWANDWRNKANKRKKR